MSFWLSEPCFVERSDAVARILDLQLRKYLCESCAAFEAWVDSFTLQCSNLLTSLSCVKE